MEKRSIAVIGVLGAALATGATLLETRKAAAPPPPSTGCRFTLVAQDADNSEYFPANAGPLCPDRIVFAGKTYWLAQQDLPLKRMIYRQHVALKPPAPVVAPLVKKAALPTKGPRHTDSSWLPSR